MEDHQCISTYKDIYIYISEIVFIENILNKNNYLHILKFLKKCQKYKQTYKFYQDNDSKHKIRIVQEFLLYNCTKILQLLLKSFNLNFIENL